MTARCVATGAGLSRRGVLALPAAMLGGCALSPFGRLQRNLDELGELGALFGEAVTPAGALAGAVTVVALERQPQGWRVDSHATSLDGRFVLRVTARRPYTVLVFDDPARSRRPDPARGLALVQDWPAGVGEGTAPRRVVLEPGRWRSLEPGLRAALDALPAEAARALPVAIGAAARLDDAMFDAASGSLGLWAPADFLASLGGGIYRLQPPDARKTPVLLVHGAAGSPRDFAAIAGALDAQRVQPWVFHYPSGLRLDAAARMLSGIVVELHRRQRIPRLCVVAHSMGGLVAHAAVRLLSTQAPELRVPLLATISSPWGGHDAAAWGVRFAPTVVPSWIDMQADSEFQRRLRQEGLPAATAHDLYFSYRGRGDDGTVTLRSQLQPAVQAGARRVLGFDEDHTSVLGQAALLSQLGRSTAAA